MWILYISLGHFLWNTKKKMENQSMLHDIGVWMVIIGSIVLISLFYLDR